MKRNIRVLAAVLAALCLPAFTIRAQNPEEAAARVPLENYFKAHATGQGDYIRKAFHPEARVMWMREGAYTQISRDEFAARFNGKPADDEAQRKRTIESLSITGNAAVAKLVLDYPTVRFTDYMTLLKIDGEWKIVSKAFNAEPKTKP